MLRPLRVLSCGRGAMCTALASSRILVVAALDVVDVACRGEAEVTLVLAVLASVAVTAQYAQATSRPVGGET